MQSERSQGESQHIGKEQQTNIYKMERGPRAGAAPGGGSESLRDTEQKTVGPSRVKKREFAGPPVSRDPDRI